MNMADQMYPSVHEYLYKYNNVLLRFKFKLLQFLILSNE